jgi:hypothetical protein
MRILGFTRMWPKLAQDDFTTFRFTRKDKDWQITELVQCVYKPRSKDRQFLGIACITSKAPRIIDEITREEAIEDGFINLLELHLFFWPAFKTDSVNKLYITWVEKSAYLLSYFGQGVIDRSIPNICQPSSDTRGTTL